MNILIVDDHQTLLMLLSTFLEGANYQIVTATNGSDGLTYLRQANDLPRLILLDVAMPTMNGWDFLREQQRDTRLASIPVVLMSALGPLDRTDLPASVVAYLQKPIDLCELEALLCVHASRHTASIPSPLASFTQA